ncbi:6-carboxytetrahydropterin synthase QueD [Thermodesulfobacteriota bacterium]
MFELKIKTDFSAAHNLRGYEGECESLHGHNWYVEVFCRSKVLNNIGLVVDFKVIKTATNELLDEFDHNYLNELEYFKEVNPSSENIAKHLFEKLTEKFKDENATITKVTVYESLNASASYFNEE